MVGDLGQGSDLQVHPACIYLLQLHPGVILLDAVFHDVPVLLALFVNCPGVISNLSMVALHSLAKVGKPMIWNPWACLCVFQDVM